ncbi:MAG: 50S ribosomal protein L13 [Planctomycetota bacterium]
MTIKSDNNRTILLKKEEVKPQWYVVDASDKILGRMATKIATVLLGKDKPTYTPYVDSGNFVVVINAEKIKLTGKKPLEKVYQRYTGYSNGLKHTPIATVLAKTPEKVVYLAVKRMLPANRLTKGLITKLKVYAGPKHPHQAQNPKVLEV